MGVQRLAVANGPNIFQMLLVIFITDMEFIQTDCAGCDSLHLAPYQFVICCDCVDWGEVQHDFYLEWFLCTNILQFAWLMWCFVWQQQVDVILSQLAYKDSRIIELDSEIQRLHQTIIDLRESVSEKDEVIRARDEAIQIMRMTQAETGEVLMNVTTGEADTATRESLSSELREQQQQCEQLSASLADCETKFSKFKSLAASKIKALENELSALREVTVIYSSQSG